MLKLIRYILSPLTFVYKYIIALRNYFFDTNIFKQEFINAKVISVGNLTMGGSGKTPLVINIVKHLKGCDHKTDNSSYQGDVNC